MQCKLKQFRVKGLGYMSLGFRVLNFPNRAGPSRLGSSGKLGSWKICTSVPLAMSQFPKECWAKGAAVIWEIGKSVPLAIFQFPNFLNSAGPYGLGAFAKLGNLYPISQIVLGHPNIPNSAGPYMGWGHLGNWKICL